MTNQKNGRRKEPIRLYEIMRVDNHRSSRYAWSFGRDYGEAMDLFHKTHPHENPLDFCANRVELFGYSYSIRIRPVNVLKERYLVS